MESSTTVEINADIATVWDAVGNPETWPAWDPQVKGVTPASPGSAPGVGSEYAVDGGWLNQQQVTIVDYRPRESMSISAKTTDGRFRFDYVLEPRVDGPLVARLTMASEDVSSTLSSIVGAFGYDMALSALANSLRDHCEAQSPRDPELR